MAVHTRLRKAIFAALLAASASACADGDGPTCGDSATAQTTLASLPFDGDRVVFQYTTPLGGREAKTIVLIRYRHSAGCQPEPVDRYEEEGGPPRLESTFVHAVQGVPNLFAIVSWPVWHAGEGIRGTYYAVHAYRAEGDALVLNPVLARHPALHGGIVGTVGGAPSTFEGATRDGVVAILGRLDPDEDVTTP